MAEKQVHTMATAEKVASGSDWHIPLWTADGEVLLQKKGKTECTLCKKAHEESGSSWNRELPN